MNSHQQKLYKIIDDILWFEWDPMGINNVGARNEYDSYVPQVYHLKISGASKTEIANYLEKVATANMGLTSMIEFNEKIADRIVALEDDSADYE